MTGSRLKAPGVFLLLLACAAPARPAETQKPLSGQNRLAIVRALAFEFATLRQPLPASKKFEEGVYVASTGQINHDKLRGDLAARGVVLQPGEVVQITAVQFRSAGILFEINGGGRKKKKWYQRVQIGIGGPGGPVGGDVSTNRPSPEEPGGKYVPGGGSWVVLTFEQRVTDVAPDEVKQMLSGVLDFNRKRIDVPWIETIPEEFRKAIEEKKVIPGMTREMVVAAKGRPERRIRELREGEEVEEWLYGQPPFVTFVHFNGETVTEVKEYR